MRPTSFGIALALITAVSASGLAGRHEGHDHGDTSMSMSSNGTAASSTSSIPSSASASATSSISAAGAAAASSGAASLHITRPGALTGALAIVDYDGTMKG
ncbi:uncharacterized protein MKK02DRAFT_42426 [Dioszegia hungarica]|uniref:Uncharacterized protein n=1 Tax=Dioszegia hungarica TaxID=4972 RepID=A0AA38HER4_9TREE|nr:uncharacterized protein MKK02DRAFT_42426 [Dioszegia hungarica]KAI9638044.1 hypothetical protein MKK02DRAFT_42426 [Dioszegia hungarica]